MTKSSCNKHVWTMVESLGSLHCLPSIDFEVKTLPRVAHPGMFPLTSHIAAQVHSGFH